MNRSAFTLAIIALLPTMPVTAKGLSSDIHVSGHRVDPDVRTFKVSYADLNLRNEAGIASLTSRIRGAVRRVCEPADYYNLSELMPTRHCIQNAMYQAKADMAFAIARTTGGERIAAREPLQLTVRSR